MLARLFSKLFRRNTRTSSARSRPTSPPPPLAGPPPPPPPPPAAPPAGSFADPLDMAQPLAAEDATSPALLHGQSAGADPGPEEGTGRVRIILEDGTLAKPSLDPELEERLRYIVDNIVPPSDPSSA